VALFGPWLHRVPERLLCHSFELWVSSFEAFQKCELGRGKLPEVFTAEARRSPRKIRQVVFDTESRGSRGIGVGSGSGVIRSVVENH
jgi:hypothetical protein